MGACLEVCVPKSEPPAPISEPPAPISEPPAPKSEPPAQTQSEVALASAASEPASKAASILAPGAKPAAAAPTWANTVPFVPPVESGVVIKVYDGDTITVAAMPLTPYCGIACAEAARAGPMYRFAVRLRGIDAPELKGSGPAEHAAAVASRDALAGLLLGRAVALRNRGVEKYGRLLADVYLPNYDANANSDLFINGWMLENKHAVVYDGGTKAGFSE
jgi:micrococcal nuclease